MRWAALWLALAAGCASEPTQIVLAIDTDIQSPDPLERIDVEVSSDRVPPTRFEVSLTSPDAPRLPLSMALYPLSPSDPAGLVFVRVRALDAWGSPIVLRDVHTRFVPGSSRLLRVLLTAQCQGVVCGAAESCGEHGCRSIEIDGAELPHFDGVPPRLTGTACTAEPESCNGFDDDCDGTADNGFDLRTDPDNCGRCGRACVGPCVGGYCPDEAPLQVALGGAHGCVRRGSGTIACWGWNYDGQLGTDLPYVRYLPADLPSTAGLGRATDVTAGSVHTCVLSAGVVSCAGDGSLGQLGDGTGADRWSFAPVSGLGSVFQIAAGMSHSCAVLMDGSVRCWGLNADGQLGDGTRGTPALAPVAVSALTTAVGVSCGTAHTCAIDRSGNVGCWGSNAHGRLGDGMTTTGVSSTPIGVVGITGAAAVGAGRRHSCALTGGQVWCWGANESHQLGNGSPAPSPVPVQVMGIDDAMQLSVAAGGVHSCVVRATGDVTCWGSNLAGQLGDTTRDDHTMPVRAAVRGAVAVATGGNADDGRGWSCALLSDHLVSCWGDGQLGRLGWASAADTGSPTPIRGLP